MKSHIPWSRSKAVGTSTSNTAMIAGFREGIIPPGEPGNATVWGVSGIEGARFVSPGQALVKQGLPVSSASVRLPSSLCKLRPCGHYGTAPRYDLPTNLTVSADPLGSLTVEPWMEPADAIEQFARAAAAKGRTSSRRAGGDAELVLQATAMCRQTLREDRKAVT